MSRFVGFAALSILALAIFFAAYLAIAEFEFQRGTPESVARAAELRPDNTRYLALRALQLDYDGANDVPLLERIAALNPVSSSPRIRLGLGAELRGDFATAEHWLLSAARVDRQFEPSWTLANFYFRRERPADFWTWIRQALEVSYGDRTPAFELCWRMASDPAEALERGIPERPEVASSYLYYLLERHRDALENAAVEEPVLRLARSAIQYDNSAVYALCDLSIDKGRASGARTVWTLLGNPVVAGFDVAGIIDGDFRGPARGRGFDWRMEGGPGVVHLPLDGGGHRVALSGKEQESASLLRQFVVLQPGKRYALRWKTRTTGIAMPAGFSWTAGTASQAVESSADWREGSLTFTAASAVMPVALVYRRPSGQPRAEGSVDVTGVSLTTGD